MSESLNPAFDMIPSDGLTDSGPAGANSLDNSMGQSEMSLYHSAQFSFERTTNTLLKPSCGPLIIPMQAVCMHYPSSPFGLLQIRENLCQSEFAYFSPLAFQEQAT
jgi:hypothetical protein